MCSDTLGFTATVADEIREIRRRIPRATAGVIYDDADTIFSEERLEELQEHLESHLQDDVVPVYAVQGKDDTRAINLVDCVKIMSIVRAKGLEYDGAVLIGQGSRWGREMESLGDICRNRLYVAVSRPTSALAIVTRSHPSVFDPLIAKGLCELFPQR